HPGEPRQHPLALGAVGDDVLDRLRARVERAQREGSLAPRLAAAVAGSMDDDRQEPGPERRSTAEARERAPRLHEALLDRVLGIGCGARDEERGPEGDLQVLAHELGVGVRIAVQRTLKRALSGREKRYALPPAPISPRPPRAQRLRTSQAATPSTGSANRKGHQANPPPPPDVSFGSGALGVSGGTAVPTPKPPLCPPSWI